MARHCTIPSCDRSHEARGYCRPHYERWKRHGDPLAGRTRTRSPEESFEQRTERDPRTGCLLWTGTTTPNGYGLIWDGDTNAYAHRYAWEREHGPIPEGMKLDHRDHCPKTCCETAHLRLATNAENVRNRAGATKSNRTTGIRNVYPEGHRFRVIVGGRYGGTFDSVDEARSTAARMRESMFGSYQGKD